MDYDEMIYGGVYAVLSTLAYAPGKEVGDEELENAIRATADSYVTGPYRYHLQIILGTSTDIKHILSDIHGDDWADQTMQLAYWLYRQDLIEAVLKYMEDEHPMPEMGGVFPLSNERQIWLGPNAPLVMVDHTNLPKGLDLAIPDKTFCRIFLGSGITLVLEGPQSENEVDDLYQMAYGGLLTVRARRLYLQTNTPMAPLDEDIGIVVNRLALWGVLKVKEFDVEKHQALLSHLPQ